jgi:hypothetical protein
MSEPTVVRLTWTAAGITRTSEPGAHPASASLDEERREVLDSVLEALASNPPDPDELAACRHLLKRLTDTAGRPGGRCA